MLRKRLQERHIHMRMHYREDYDHRASAVTCIHCAGYRPPTGAIAGYRSPPPSLVGPRPGYVVHWYDDTARTSHRAWASSMSGARARRPPAQPPWGTPSPGGAGRSGRCGSGRCGGDGCGCGLGALGFGRRRRALSGRRRKAAGHGRSGGGRRTGRRRWLLASTSPSSSIAAARC